MARQPKRILSTRARSLAGTTRVATSERKRLQNAINRMQKDIDDYNASIQKRKKEKGMWNFLSKAGSVLSTVGAATANPIIAGIGVGATAIGSAKEYQKTKDYGRAASRLKTDLAKGFEKKLFVGQSAKDVTAGMESYKDDAVQSAEDQRKLALKEGLMDTGAGVLQAGQAGTFGGKISNFLNKPIASFETTEGMSDTGKFLVQQANQSMGSIGSIGTEALGGYGVTPSIQQGIGARFGEKIPGSANYTGKSFKSFDSIKVPRNDKNIDRIFNQTFTEKSFNTVPDVNLNMPTQASLNRINNPTFQTLTGGGIESAGSFKNELYKGQYSDIIDAKKYKSMGDKYKQRALRFGNIIKNYNPPSTGGNEFVLQNLLSGRSY